MRRRTMRRPMRRGSRRRLSWLNGIAANTCAVPLTMNLCRDEVGIAFAPDLFLLAESPVPAIQGSISENREGTVTRIVGEILLDAAFATVSTQTGWTVLNVNMGIYIADADVLGAPLARDPSFDMENKDWLWKGTYSTSECFLAPTTVFTCHQNDLAGEGTNANGSHIDIKVKRKLREEEQILLAVVCEVDTLVGNGEGSWQAFLNGSVRVLVAEA